MPEFKGTQTPVLALRHVTASAPDGTQLLDDVSFSADRGQLIAIVGPTGAGKTSLARVLTGALKIDEGEVAISGSVAFVPQHDTLHMDLPLRRGLEYAADLRLANVDAQERSARVTSVMRELGIEQHGSTIVRDLSVGQRKRANVAAQLLGDPDVIVLDEPTAGLDPGYERVVQNMLRALADSGRTVINVTHSVDALKASDRVLFLAAGGEMAFFGPPAQATKYFKSSDAAEVFLALDTAGDWKARFQNSALYKKLIGPAEVAESEPTEPTRTGHLRMLVKRHFDLLRGDRRHLWLLAAQAPVIGALLWSVLPANGLVRQSDGTYGNHAAVVVMFLVLSVTWLGVTNAIREIVKDRNIFKSEIPAGLSARSYVTSKAVSVGTMTMAQSALIAFVATLRQHAHGSGAVLGSARVELIVISAIAGLAAATLGLALSSMAKSADKALAFLPMTLVLQLVLAGAWAQDSSFFVLRQLRALMGARWGMDAMASTLRGNAGDLFTDIAALLALTVLGTAVAAVRVGFVTRPATQPLPSPRAAVMSVTRQVRNAGIGMATALSVLASLAAGGTGVVAMVHTRNAAATGQAAAAATTTTHKGTKAHTTATTTPEVTTTTTIPVVETPATTPTTVKAPAKATHPVQNVVNDLTDTVNDVVQPVGDVLQDVLTPPTTAPPVTTPTTTPAKPNPISQLFNIWKIFIPTVNR